jgi:hypothetical protein
MAVKNFKRCQRWWLKMFFLSFYFTAKCLEQFFLHLTITLKGVCRWFRFAQLAKGKKFRP